MTGGVPVSGRLRPQVRRLLRRDGSTLPTAVAQVSVVVGVALTATGMLPSPPAVEELVSVVVCTLGRERRLQRTVEAVLGQTHRHLQLVVVDNDPASGRTAALLAGVGDPRLRRVPHAERGLSSARNAGLSAARG